LWLYYLAQLTVERVLAAAVRPYEVDARLPDVFEAATAGLLVRLVVDAVRLAVVAAERCEEYVPDVWELRPVVQHAAVPVAQHAGFLPSAPGVQHDAPLDFDEAALVLVL
jgi:hypothetical protein